MSTILENIDTSNQYRKRIHVKGASEIVKNCCSHYLDVDGNVREMTDEMNQNLDNVIHNSYITYFDYASTPIYLRMERRDKVGCNYWYCPSK